MERLKALCLTIGKNKAVFYLIVLLFCLLWACLSNNYDYDLFARLIVGESFIEKGVINYQDFLSYTPTHLWYDHEWGASVFFYLFFKYFGAYGLILIHTLLLFGTTFFVLKTQAIQKCTFPCTLAFTAFFIFALSHLNPSIVRCHMFSFMFFALFLFLLEKCRRFNSNAIWLIPPVVLIWNNIHGGVVSGMGMVFIYMIGAILTKKSWKKYFFVLLVSALLLAINPYGVDYYSFLISANTKTRTFITEWWWVFAQRHVLYYYPTFIAAVFLIVLSIFNIFKRKNFSDTTKLLALITTTTLGSMHVKLLSLTVIVIGALYYNEIAKLFSKNSIRIIEKIAYVIIPLSVLYIPFTHPYIPRVNFNKFPVIETEFLKENNIKGNILTSFGLGSYVSYKLYPQNLIYMDGRYEEVYYDEEFDNLITYEQGKEGWEIVYKDYPTEIIMPEKTMAPYKILKQSKDWVQIFDGPACGVFVRKGTEKQSYKQPSDRLKYYQFTAFDNMGKFGKQ